MSVVLPAPERPYSAVSPGVGAVKVASSPNVAAVAAQVRGQHAQRPQSPADGAREQLCGDEAREPEREADERDARGRRIAVGGLQRRVERDGERARHARARCPRK